MIQKKICLLGAPAVGKTSLVTRFVQSIFSEKYLTTVGVKIDKKTVNISGTEVTLVLWDLAGESDFQHLEMSYLRGASGYLLVADGTRGKTLDKAVELQTQVSAALGSLPFVFVINKADLTEEWEITEGRLSELNSSGWMIRSSSAKDGIGVEGVFSELARVMIGGSRSLSHG
jgi:small GTP-binding protein